MKRATENADEKQAQDRGRKDEEACLALWDHLKDTTERFTRTKAVDSLVAENVRRNRARDLISEMAGILWESAPGERVTGQRGKPPEVLSPIYTPAGAALIHQFSDPHEQGLSDDELMPPLSIGGGTNCPPETRMNTGAEKGGISAAEGVISSDNQAGDPSESEIVMWEEDL